MTVRTLPPRTILGHLYTIFLFTRADIRTVMIPTTLFAIAAAPLSSPLQLFDTFFWIWLHTLQFNTANQIKSPEEDKINKPFRPIPSGRITVEAATILRWALVPICLAYSALYSAELTWVSLTMSLFVAWYHEHDGDQEWLSKNVLTAVIYGCVDLGGTLVAGRCPCPLCHLHVSHDIIYQGAIIANSARQDGSLWSWWWQCLRQLSTPKTSRISQEINLLEGRRSPSFIQSRPVSRWD
ncbi:hypothetical protein ID866_12415 [Astraeus odoratus]|nr:hypothetical protein ID866_12415 [Astraeus odoratus]